MPSLPFWVSYAWSGRLISAQKPCGKQQNAKVGSCESAIFRLLALNHYVQERYLKTSSSTRCHFITKLFLITPQSFTTAQCLHSYKLTLSDKSCSQFCLVAICCIGRHLLMLYACKHIVSFPNERPVSLVWEWDYCTSEITSWPASERLARSLPV